MLRRTAVSQGLSLALGIGMLLSIVTLQCSLYIYRYLDLRPLAAAIQPYKDKPLVYARKYDGEIGYLARLDRKIESIPRGDLPAWFREHPDGFAIVRYRKDPDLDKYKILFTQRYQEGKFYSLVVLKTNKAQPASGEAAQ